MNDASTAALNQLIDGCCGSAERFRRAGLRASSPELRTWFEERARQCVQAADKLQLEVEREDDASADDDDGDAYLLRLCERSEQDTMSRYVEALAEPLPGPIGDVVQKQYDALLRHQRQIGALYKRIGA